jgi:ferric-dicitrate binding protein FerR (iron transport regulator)
MSDNHIKKLLQRYLDDSLSDEEVRSVLESINKGTYDGALQEIVDEALEKDAFAGLSDRGRYDMLFSRLLERATEKERPLTVKHKNGSRRPAAKKVIFYLAAVAASAMLLITISTLRRSDEQTPVQTVADLPPGGNRAMLTLGDGSTILLDSAAIGQLAEQAGTRVMKVDDGRLAYNSEGRRKAETVYNTITTPRAGQYELILPDSSRVWLNSESSIRFPVSFSGSFRVVEITGEAYFEVAENREMPFRVSSGNTTVEVLGTSFNVRAYTDEGSVNTTLVEGSVQVASPVNLTTIVPGQQARVTSQGLITVENNVDLEEIISWKNGLFMFNSATIEQIMSQVSRWYDVEIQFIGEKSNKTFSGIVSRKSNVSELLRIMEGAGVRFTVSEESIKIEMQ